MANAPKGLQGTQMIQNLKLVAVVLAVAGTVVIVMPNQPSALEEMGIRLEH